MLLTIQLLNAEFAIFNAWAEQLKSANSMFVFWKTVSSILVTEAGTTKEPIKPLLEKALERIVFN